MVVVADVLADVIATDTTGSALLALVVPVPPPQPISPVNKVSVIPRTTRVLFMIRLTPTGALSGTSTAATPLAR
jgi:hypothetical protein